jgi:8-oxo-dGTP pyrophosphatase MutT (NUDIX family)
MGVEPRVRKAFAYVTRRVATGYDLLVFRSLDEPEGFEVPKGAVDPGETFEEGARRELFEEAGLENLVVVADLGTTWYGNEEQRFFHFAAPSGVPHRFDHTVTGLDGDAGEVYALRFLPIDDRLADRLVQGSSAFVNALRKRLAAWGADRRHHAKSAT